MAARDAISSGGIARLRAKTLQRYVRIFLNQRLRDRMEKRGIKAKAPQPKAYPLEGTSWSSCDESEEEPNSFLKEATTGAV